MKKKNIYYETKDGKKIKIVFKDFKGRYLIKNIWKMIFKHEISFTLDESTTRNLGKFISNYIKES